MTRINREMVPKFFGHASYHASGLSCDWNISEVATIAAYARQWIYAYVLPWFCTQVGVVRCGCKVMCSAIWYESIQQLMSSLWPAIMCNDTPC